MLAGRKEDAKRIWTLLAADSKGTMAGEARLRLGELEAAQNLKAEGGLCALLKGEAAGNPESSPATKRPATTAETSCTA